MPRSTKQLLLDDASQHRYSKALNGCLATKFEKVEPNSVLHHRLMLEKDDAHIIINTEMKTFGHGLGLGLMTTSQSQGQGQKSKAKVKVTKPQG